MLNNFINYNDATCVCAIDSYNIAPGSVLFPDKANGVSSVRNTGFVGNVAHSSDVGCYYINSSSSLWFPNRTGYIWMDGSEEFNFYNLDWVISLACYPTGRNNAVVLTYYQDSKNYWDIYYYSNRYLQFKITHNGVNWVDKRHDWENYGYNRWHTILLTKIGGTCYFYWISNTSVVRSMAFSLSEMPYFDPVRSKLIIGGWVNDDLSINTNWSFAGAINSVYIAKRTFRFSNVFIKRPF